MARNEASCVHRAIQPPRVKHPPIAFGLVGRIIGETGKFGSAAPRALWQIGDLGVLAKGEPSVQDFAAGKAWRATTLHAVTYIRAGESISLHERRKPGYLFYQLVFGRS